MRYGGAPVDSLPELSGNPACTRAVRHSSSRVRNDLLPICWGASGLASDTGHGGVAGSDRQNGVREGEGGHISVMDTGPRPGLGGMGATGEPSRHSGESSSMRWTGVPGRPHDVEGREEAEPPPPPPGERPRDGLGETCTVRA